MTIVREDKEPKSPIKLTKQNFSDEDSVEGNDGAPIQMRQSFQNNEVPPISLTQDPSKNKLDEVAIENQDLYSNERLVADDQQDRDEEVKKQILSLRETRVQEPLDISNEENKGGVAALNKQLKIQREIEEREVNER